MATASTVALVTGHHGEYAVNDLSRASAEAASSFLQRNHDKHDIIFNDAGFHSESSVSSFRS